MPDSGVPASTFPPAARAAFRTLSPFFSPTHFHEEPKFVERAPVKHQCSRDYFYGEDPALEKALQAEEGLYAAAARDILTPDYTLTDTHRAVLRHFWLLQHMRTEAASQRAVEMTAETGALIGVKGPEFNLGIRQAVLLAMRVFVDVMRGVDDLKVCLLRNLTEVPFITSDDPAVLSNWWYLEDARTRTRSFGLNSAGDLLLLPLSPQVLCLGYDGDVYSISDAGGWVAVRHSKHVEALNQSGCLPVLTMPHPNGMGFSSVA